MKLALKGRLAACLLLLPGIGVLAAEDVAALKFEYEVFQGEITDDFESQRANLYDKYAAAIRRQQEVFQNQGNLEAALAAKAQADLAEQERKHGEAGFPGAAKLRDTLIQAEVQIEKAEVAQFVKLRQRYIQLANALQVEMTKAGQLEEAISARDFIQELEKNGGAVASDPAGSRTPSSMIASSSRGTKKLSVALEQHSQSVLHSNKPVTGDHELLPGRYSGFSTVKLGDRSLEDKNKRGASLKIPPGTEVSSGHIYADVANVELKESLFNGVRFGQNLHSSFTADSCIFSECSFGKEGGWGAALSSRWTFENCVISASFFSSWRKRQVGVQMRNCTFEDVVFESYPFHEDAGKEAIDDWFVFERCLFRNCTIPESVLIGTVDCAFENCKIVPDEIKISSDIRVTLYEKDSTLDPPRERQHITYTLKSVDQLANKSMGSNLDYSMRAKKAIPNP